MDQGPQVDKLIHSLNIMPRYNKTTGGPSLMEPMPIYFQSKWGSYFVEDLSKSGRRNYAIHKKQNVM